MTQLSKVDASFYIVSHIYIVYSPSKNALIVTKVIQHHNHSPSPHSRNRRPLLPNLILPKLLHIPLFPLNSPRQHSKYLIHQKRSCRRTSPPRRHPEPKPLNPLAKVMRIQHVPKQPSLRNLVVLFNAVGRATFLPTDAVLPLLLAAADVSELVVVEKVG